MVFLRALVVCLSLGCLAASQADAALIVDIKEVGGSVVYTVSGSLNVSGFPSFNTLWNGTALNPSLGMVSIDTIGPFSCDEYSNLFDSPASLIYGTGGEAYPASSQSGDNFALDPTGAYS